MCHKVIKSVFSAVSQSIDQFSGWPTIGFMKMSYSRSWTNLKWQSEVTKCNAKEKAKCNLFLFLGCSKLRFHLRDTRSIACTLDFKVTFIKTQGGTTMLSNNHKQIILFVLGLCSCQVSGFLIMILELYTNLVVPFFYISWITIFFYSQHNCMSPEPLLPV